MFFRIVSPDVIARDVIYFSLLLLISSFNCGCCALKKTTSIGLLTGEMLIGSDELKKYKCSQSCDSSVTAYCGKNCYKNFGRNLTTAYRLMKSVIGFSNSCDLAAPEQTRF